MEKNKMKVNAKKNLGQNFLIDENIINNIISNIDAKEKDLIIEIGPGMGALTCKLKDKNSYLICYEIDTDLKVYLNKYEDLKTKIIYKDILLSNIKDDIKDIKYNNLYIIGNLPYYITTKIIKHIISLDLNINKMIFMVQKEVADRFTAKPKSKDYGSITIYLNHYFNVTKLFNVSKNSFNPIPKVESGVISFIKKDNIIDLDTNKYFKLINDSFKMKRKTLKNNLSNYNQNIIDYILKKYNLSETVRAEELSEEIFIDLFNELNK